MKTLFQLRHNIIGKIELDKMVELIFLTHEIDYKAKRNENQMEIIKEDKLEQFRCVSGYENLIAIMAELIALIEEEFPEAYRKTVQEAKKSKATKQQTEMELE